MSLVLKSNVASTAANLTSVALLTQTPQQYYDAFVARVQADGGEIVNSTELLNTINFLFDKKLIGKLNGLVGARYAVKRSGGNITKVYSLDGVDFVAKMFGSGQPPLLNTTDTAKPYIDMRNAGVSFNNATLLKSEKKFVQSRNKRIAASIVMQNVSAMTGIIVNSIDSDVATQATPMWRVNAGAVGTATMQIGVAAEPYDPAAGQNSMVYNGFTAAANAQPISFLADGQTVKLETVINGGVTAALTRATPTAAATVEQYLTIGGYETNSSKGSGVGNFYEMWFFNNATESDLLLVDAYLKSRYV